VTATIVIGRLQMRWRTDAELREADRARLDGLVRELCDGPLEDALTDIPGGQAAEVCIRRVVVPPHHARWGTADAELLAGWAGAIGRAVRATTGPGGDVVRFASRAHAQADLVASVLAGDRERIWAWRLLGLWPAGNWTDAEAVSGTVATAVAERPGALVALAVAAARAARLGRFTDYLGSAALAEFTRRAWRAAGGTDGPRSRAGGQAGFAETAVTGRLAALLRQRSQIVACTLARPPARLAAPAGPDDAGPAVSSRAPAGPGPLAESLAALALLEVEPAMAAHPATWSAVAATARGLLPATNDTPRSLPATPAAARRPDPLGGAPADAGRRPGRPGEGPADAARRPDPPEGGTARAGPPADGDAASLPDRAAARADPLAEGGATPVPPGAGAATSWGGLLFLLPVVSELGIPASMTADPDDAGVGLRPVLHELGRQLLARAAPDAEPPGAGDPALLAFCGLSPGSEPPGRPGAAATRRIGLAAGSVAAALRERLTGPGSHRGDPALLLGVCRRHAVIHADPGWIDVDLRLDEVDVDVRRAGLDLDPGYLPWLGCVVRFRYV
jgi:hypothetical protein